MIRRGVTDFLAGIRLLGSGLKRYARSPRLLLLGLVPAVLTLLLFTGLFIALFYFLGDLTSAATWFADGWTAGAREGARTLAGIAIVGVTGLLAIVSYTAVTLLVGDPFYEAIAESIENELGPVPDEVQRPWYRSIGRSIADSLRLLLRSLAVAIPLFALGFIPVVGQTVVPVLGALVGGWFLALELVGLAFNRRGLRLRDRRRALRAHRALALGFGTAVFCCFLIPFGAILIMPAAVAGGTLLGRRALGLPIRAADQPPAPALQPAGDRPGR